MNKSIHAFSNDCLSDFDGCDLVKLIRSREVSKKEIIESTINRIEIALPPQTGPVLELVL